MRPTDGIFLIKVNCAEFDAPSSEFVSRPRSVAWVVLSRLPSQNRGWNNVHVEGHLHAWTIGPILRRQIKGDAEPADDSKGDEQLLKATSNGSCNSSAAAKRAYYRLALRGSQVTDSFVEM